MTKAEMLIQNKEIKSLAYEVWCKMREVGMDTIEFARTHGNEPSHARPSHTKAVIEERNNATLEYIELMKQAIEEQINTNVEQEGLFGYEFVGESETLHAEMEINENYERVSNLEVVQEDVKTDKIKEENLRKYGFLNFQIKQLISDGILHTGHGQYLINGERLLLNKGLSDMVVIKDLHKECE